MPCIFVSYRREDSAGFAGRLTDALESRFGIGSVFRDVDDIAPGADFEATIDSSLQKVQAVLVVIGPGWINASADGERRLDREDDFVRREIQRAFEKGKPVVPVLVGGAAMPRAAALPASIRRLATVHAMILNDATWSEDLSRLESVLSPRLQRSRGFSRKRYRLGVLLAALTGTILAYMLLRPYPDADLKGFDGSWQAQVSYPWGVSTQERFDLVVRNGNVEGRAGYLGVARTIEQPEWRDGQLLFVTRSLMVAGSDQPLEIVHHYRMQLVGNELHVILESRGNYSAEPVIEFIARRQ